MKKYCLLLCCLFAMGLFAQPSIDNFTRLESSGDIPSDFQEYVNSKKKDATTYYIKEQFISGNILYGSILNDYVNTVADNLLKEYPDLKEKLRFYIVKSTDVNAYCTESGILFINIGLIAQVSNESELAYIMAHEIAHFAEHHILDLDDYKDKNKSGDYKEFYLKYHNRSRENELAADRLALERYYKSSPYSFSVLDGVFDVLQYDYLPFDEIAFNRSLIETDFYKFPDNYFLTNINPIRSREDYIDTLSTHPNIMKRRENVRQIVSGLNNDGRKTFVQPESLFNEMRELARFECINIFLTQHEYDDAIYNTNVLIQSHSENEFLDVAMAAALYGISKHKTYGGIKEIVENYKTIEGEKQQVNFIFGKLNKNELNLLALRYLWNAHKKYPQNVYLTSILTDISRDLVGRNNLEYTDFSDYPMGTNAEDIVDKVDTLDTTATTKVLGKYDRIKQQNKSQSSLIKPSTKFKTYNYMLVDLRKDPEFTKLFNDAVNYAEDKKVNEIIADKDAVVKIYKILIVKPIYSKYVNKSTTRKMANTSKNYQKERTNIEKTIQYSVDKIGIDNIFYSDKFLTELNTDQYNQFCRVEAFKNDFVKSEFNNMILYQAQDFSNVIGKMGLSSINLVSIYTRPDGFNGKKLIPFFFLSPMCVASAPFMLLNVIMPTYYTNVRFIVFNPETGQTTVDDSFSVSSETRESYINSFIYNKYYQIKKGK